jgi:hypothetical protein
MGPEIMHASEGPSQSDSWGNDVTYPEPLAFKSESSSVVLGDRPTEGMSIDETSARLEVLKVAD